MSDLLGGNQFFEGGLWLMILGATIAAAAMVPRIAWNLFQRWLTTTAYIRDGQLVHWLSDWLQETEKGEPRWWMAEVDNSGAADARILMKPGQGLHVMRRLGRRLLIWSTLEDNGIAGKIHTMTIRTYGRDPATIRQVMNSARELAEERTRGKNVTFINDVWGDWREIRLGAPRPLRTIVLRRGLMEEISADLQRFLESKGSYEERGIPYRRGYLFEGPPGNGKSTLVQGLATEFKLPIYSLVLSDREFSDARLARAVGALPSRAILLLEDVDRIDYARTGVTLAGILNSVDGALASEGRILIVTANNPDRLDPAFRREGRMDRTWKVENPNPESIQRMAERFYPELEAETLRWFARSCADSGWSMAKVQGLLQNVEPGTVELVL